MSLYNLYTLVLGIVMPLIVAVVLRETWRTEVKTAVALVVCTLSSTIFCYFQGKLDGQDLMATIVAVNGVSMTLFNNFWKPLGVTNPLESLDLNLQFLRGLFSLSSPNASAQTPVASSPDNEFDPSTDN